MGTRHPVVGAWRVAVSVPGADVHGVNLATLADDGTMAVASPSPTPAPPGSPHKLEYWSTALGSWEATGERTAAMAFVALGADENGNPIGTHTVTATVEAAADDSDWSGPFRIEVAGADGAVLGGVDGTAAATAIGPPRSGG
jgi:hypothetical protein